MKPLLHLRVPSERPTARPGARRVGAQAAFALLFYIISLPMLPAAASTAADARQLAGLLAGVDGFIADFEHRLLDADGAELDSSRGWMAWQRPDRFRWEIEQPGAQTLLVKGGVFYQYDRDLEQMLVQPASGEVALLPGLLAGNADAIDKRYEVEQLQAVLPLQVQNSRRAANAGAVYRLRPRETGLFAELLLTFEDGQLRSMRIVDDMQQDSLFDFSPRAQGIENTLFVVEPSPGTEIIHQ